MIILALWVIYWAFVRLEIILGNSCDPRNSPTQSQITQIEHLVGRSEFFGAARSGESRSYQVDQRLARQSGANTFVRSIGGFISTDTFSACVRNHQRIAVGILILKILSGQSWTGTSAFKIFEIQKIRLFGSLTTIFIQ